MPQPGAFWIHPPPQRTLDPASRVWEEAPGVKGLEPLALRRAQHTLTDRYGFTAFGRLGDIDAPHRVALVEGRPAVLIWWASADLSPRATALEAATLLGDRDDVDYVWAVATGQPGDGLVLRAGPDGVVPVDTLPDATCFVTRPPDTRLDRIDWARLSDAYGPATTTRGHLDTLLNATDPALREDAVFRLYMGICHQTVSLSEATAPAVPFLVLAGERPDEVEVLRLLTDIAELAALPLDDSPPEETAWSRRCAMALGASADRFAAWVLTAETPDRRAAALRLALATRRAAPSAAGPLEAVLDAALAHADPTMRMLAVQALAADGNRARLDGALDDPALQVRAFAALVFLTAPATDHRARAWAAITDVLAEPDAADDWYRAAPGLEGHPLPDLLEAIAAAGRPAADPVLPRVVELIERWQSPHLLAPLLRTVFPERRARPAGALDRWQVAALAALCRSRRYWRAADRQPLPSPFDGETSRAELIAALHAAPAHAALDPAEAATAFPTTTPDALAVEIVRDAARADARVVPATAGRKVRQLHLTADVDDAVFARIAALCRRLHRLELVEARITDAGLAALAHLDRLTRLRIDRLPIDGQGLAALTDHPRLRDLDLAGLAGDGAALAHLADVPHLAELALARMTLHPDSLEALAAASALSTLRLRGCRLDPPAWHAIGAIGALEHVRIGEATLPPRAVAGWRALSRLTRLTLDACVLPASALEALPELPLRRVELLGCAVDEAELRRLARLPHLRDIVFTRTPLSDGAVDVLAELPRGIRLNLSEAGLSEAATHRLARLRRRR